MVEAPDLDGVRRLNALVPLAQGAQAAAALHIGYPVEELYAKINQSLRWQLALLGLTLLVALAIAWWGSEALFLRPLNRLMRVVSKVQDGDLEARSADVRGLSELTLLGQSFDRMADALQQRETARQQAQTEQQESDARFRAVFDNAAVGVAVMTLDRHIVQINQKAIAVDRLQPRRDLQAQPIHARRRGRPLYRP